MNTLTIRALPPLLIGLTSALLAGCGGETQVEVIKPFRPQYETFRKRLAQMAALDPKSAVAPTAPLDPKPILRWNTPEANTAVFMFPQLTDQRAGLDKPIDLDLRLSGRVLTQLRVVGVPEAQMTGKANKNLRQELADGLKPRYIGAVKVLAHQPGKVDGKEYEPGRVKGAAMLFERDPVKLVFADVFFAENDDKIEFYHRKDEKADGQGWVNSNLEVNFKKAALKKFAEGTGGVFEAEH